VPTITNGAAPTRRASVCVTIDAHGRPVSVIAVPFLVVCWVLVAWKAGLLPSRSGVSRVRREDCCS
jgi:hypothetical protein